ncbi:hypothetical protein CN884_05555 [Ochrobactrum sp. 30A/1000/2015]|nr:hypothetical protein CN884_05555 [Ochrobactrum sp. 30A/1000/2015]PJT36908.1 hypothetical protein CN883_21845 [Ochrobactrum sp. 27A/999/2015]PJT41788.1 hypothetical protein CN882_19335 [Ochrobactrum sp. 23A/997/2015]
MASLQSMLPEPHGTGRPRKWAMREIVNAIFYVLGGGIAWRLFSVGFTTLADSLRLVFALSR